MIESGMGDNTWPLGEGLNAWRTHQLYSGPVSWQTYDFARSSTTHQSS